MIEVYLLSLGLTLFFELGYAWLWGLKGRDLVLIVLMNILTNPAVVAWYYATQDMGWLVSTVIPEVSAVTAECYLLRKFGKSIQKPVILGICINVFSYFSGFLFNLFYFSGGSL